MTHTKIIAFYFAITCLGAAAAHAAGDSDLENAQAEQARAFKRLQETLEKGPPRSASEIQALKEQIQGPADQQMNQLLNSRKKAQENQLYGKAVDWDGTLRAPTPQEAAEMERVSRSNAAKRPLTAEEALKAQGPTSIEELTEEASARGTAQGDSENAPAGRGQGKPGDFEPTLSAPGPVLDGSNIPKEMTFTGRKKPKAGTPPSPSPSGNP